MESRRTPNSTGHLGKCMKDNGARRLVFNAKFTTQELDRIYEQAQASGTTPYDVIMAEIDKRISEL